MTRAAPARHNFGFWAAVGTFAAVLAFSTVPSPLYVLYARRDGLSSLTVTLVFAAYAIGVLGTLLFVSHLSDVHGRRLHLLVAVALCLVSATIFMVWPALPGLYAARVLTGVAVGLTVSTATAYLAELHAANRPSADARRPQLAAAAANLGGLGVGGLGAGVMGQYLPHPLVVPYLVFAGLLLMAGSALVLSPETRHRAHPMPLYRRQRLRVPVASRAGYFGALLEVFVAYGGVSLFLGLAGTFLATVIGSASLALAGAAIFVLCGMGVGALVVTGSWSSSRMTVVGLVLDIAGLALVVVAVWLPHPSAGLFLVGGGVVGAAAALLFRSTLQLVAGLSRPEILGETLSGFFLAAYLGLSVPAVGAGLTLRVLDPRHTLLVFAIVTAVGVVASAAVVGTAARSARRTSRKLWDDPDKRQRA